MFHTQPRYSVIQQLAWYPEPSDPCAPFVSRFADVRIHGNHYVWLNFEAFSASIELDNAIYDANSELLTVDGAEKKAERENRLRRTIGERQILMLNIERALLDMPPVCVEYDRNNLPHIV